MAEQEFRAVQDVLELTHINAPVRLDDDCMLALQIVLDLDVSDAAMEKIKGQILQKLDASGKGVMTREAWRTLST